MNDIKSAAEILKKEKYSKGEIEIVGADKISSEGYLFISKYVTKRTDLTSTAKLVWGSICNHAWNDKDHCFPGQNTIAEECGCSVRSVERSIEQLAGENKTKEVFLQVIHRGRGLTDFYKLFFKMNEESIQKAKIKIRQNVRSKKKDKTYPQKE